MQARRVVSVCSFICMGGQGEERKHSSCPWGGIAAELNAAELPAMATGSSLNKVPPQSKLQGHQHCNKYPAGSESNKEGR